MLLAPRSIRRRCRFFARACSVAIVLDTYVYRPGLSTIYRWRGDPGPLSFALLAPHVYEACYRGCLLGYSISHGVGGKVTRIWVKLVKLMKIFGNAGLGSTLLLVFQSAGLGYALSRESDTIVSVMGAVRHLVELEGVEGTYNFYLALSSLSPSYLARIGYLGLPDASSSLSLQDILSKRISFGMLLREASHYDIVSRDLITGFEISLGLLVDIVCSHGFMEGVAKATYFTAAFYGDMLLERKIGVKLEKLWLRAWKGDRWALYELSLLLDDYSAGPGSSADLAVNATARCLYEHLLGLRRARR